MSQSATSAGFDSPSISTVIVRVVCSVFGSFCSTAASTLEQRIFEPTLTGVDEPHLLEAVVDAHDDAVETLGRLRDRLRQA